MLTPSVEKLWARLAAAGLVIGEKPPRRTEQQSPWFVRVMLGFAGWIGALFLLGFVGMSLQFVFRSSTASLFVGAGLCTGAAFLFRAAQGKDFAVQFGLAMSFAGQALFIYGLMDIFRLGNGVRYLSVMVFESFLAAVIMNAIHRVVCAFAAAVSLCFALSSLGVPYIAPAILTAGLAVVWLNELTWADRGQLVRAVGYGLVLAAMYMNGALLMHTYIWLGGMANISPAVGRFFHWAGIILNSAVFLFVVLRLFNREGIGLDDRLVQVALVAAVVIAGASFKAPGIIVGLVIVLLGFANGNSVLTGLGIFALIAYLSHYYYQLQATLLIKSASLAATGMVLLVTRFVINSVWTDSMRKGEHHA